VKEKEKNAAKPGFALDRLDLSHLEDLLDNGGVPGTSGGGNGPGLLESIFKAAGEIESFLTFSRQLDEINAILGMDYASTREIAEVLLKDFALTSKLLKLANSPLYLQFTHKGVLTVSEAMIILGTDQIRQTAASLMIFEFMKGLSRNRLLMDKTLASYTRGVVAREIASRAGFALHEEFQVCAMLHDFGEYIILFLHPDRHGEIERNMAETGADREEASRRILGMSYSRIGRAVALRWGIPEKIVRTMKPVLHVPRTLTAVSDTDRKRYVCAASMELFPLCRRMDQVGEDRLEDTVARFGPCLKLTAGDALRILEFARESVLGHADILGIELGETWLGL
jgi:HD-like signal output (HDOD) protein